MLLGVSYDIPFKFLSLLFILLEYVSYDRPFKFLSLLFILLESGLTPFSFVISQSNLNIKNRTARINNIPNIVKIITVMLTDVLSSYPLILSLSLHILLITE